MSGSKTSGWKQLDTGGDATLPAAQCTLDGRFLLFSAKWNWFTAQWPTHSEHARQQFWTQIGWLDICNAQYWCTGSRDSQQKMFILAVINSPSCILLTAKCALLRQNLIWFTASPNFPAWLHFRPLLYFPCLWEMCSLHKQHVATKRMSYNLFTTTSVTLNCLS